VAPPDVHDRHTVGVSELEQPGGAAAIRRQVRQPQCPDPPLAEHIDESRRVVLVRVRQHDEVEGSDPGTPEPPRSTVVRPTVEEHTGIRGLHQERVSLSDIDRGDDQRPDRRVGTHRRLGQ
jgi:hypothetical protein